MQTVYNADSIVDAQIAKDALEDAGIPAFIAGAALMGGIGQLPARGFIRIMVPDIASPEARRILAEVFPEPAADARVAGLDPAAFGPTGFKPA
ncbi:DUF2007 domain-containing protein [Metallibacterium sp.]|jgi:hypothetical protein|uniref:putative signal transducing protein n=1 Tax=Metallibacterium sp. TaxID=2940281 RepID=UPI0026375ABE|nr:DUF2007 domain-containing protein [Metallibacterium sp.]